MLEEEHILKSAWPYRKIVLPIIDLLRQGITPEKVALSIALGVTLGIFPVLGSTTILCAAAAVVLRLNLPAIQAVNYLIYPVQLILFLPLLQAGSRIAGAAPVSLSLADVFGMIKSARSLVRPIKKPGPVNRARRANRTTEPAQDCTCSFSQP
jgi:hypothetical protein